MNKKTLIYGVLTWVAAVLNIINIVVCSEYYLDNNPLWERSLHAGFALAAVAIGLAALAVRSTIEEPKIKY